MSTGRTELLSVKTTPAEKDAIIRAAKKLGMKSYSDFVRAVALAASRKMGIEERDGVSTQDVRRSYPARRRNLSVPQDDTEATVAA